MSFFLNVAQFDENDYLCRAAETKITINPGYHKPNG